MLTSGTRNVKIILTIIRWRKLTLGTRSIAEETRSRCIQRNGDSLRKTMSYAEGGTT